MTNEIQNQNTPRQAWLAFTFSLLFPGLGQVYCGRIGRGLFFMLVYLFLVPAYCVLLAHTSPIATAWLLGSVLLCLGICLIPCVDALVLTRRIRPDYRLKDYNRCSIYILLTLIGGGAALGFSLYLRNHYFEAFRVPAASMVPTILPGDRIAANKRAYRYQDPQRGDLVVFRPVVDRHRHYIKRVIAVAGDTVEIRQGQVILNGTALARDLQADSILDHVTVLHPAGPHRGQPIRGQVYHEVLDDVVYPIVSSGGAADAAADFGPITIEDHHCFVLGDHRDGSYDSRAFGPVPLATVVGRVDYLYWPVGTMSRFGPLHNLHTQGE
jgi:signal peptidase I